jgi:hypothetical protein
MIDAIEPSNAEHRSHMTPIAYWQERARAVLSQIAPAIVADERALLHRYMATVRAHDGTDFLDYLPPRHPHGENDVLMNYSDMAELRRRSRKAGA